MKRAKRWFIFLILLASLNGMTQNARVSASLDTNAMLIGDHIGLTLKFTGPPKAQVIWPFLPDTILGNISVIGRGKIDSSYAGNQKQITLSQQFTLTCYDSGFYTIPPITFRYRVLPDTTVQSVSSQLIPLMVHTLKVDTTQAIKPIAGPLRVPITFREIFPWIMLAIGVISAIVFGIWYYHKRKKKQPVFQLKPKDVLSPHEMALREMEKLRVKKLWQSGKVKEYHSELTEILRKYIEERFSVPALEQTSGEILESLSGVSDCPRTARERLRNMLILADMVKFAKSVPLASENEQSLTDGIEFVYETTGSAKTAPPEETLTKGETRQ
ncbi:MAG: hypothetical protein PHP04_05450 [Bacteroidales bacterium]|nr:hypothetical protein [Bacteroidales bacterium]HNW72766.1 hypothetical protein [Bacteroidales bacterium]HPS50143.1 hypothetical protein [Bacteroidales bacterium]